MTSDLPIGTLLGTKEPAHLLAHKLNRHTFWCGQSGSGKTYALGVLLEQVLLHTHLPLVVLDPNSDFVRLGEIRHETPVEDAARLAQRDIRIFRSDAGQGDPVKIRFVGMPVPSRAAALKIDPILDAEDFNAILRIESEIRTGIDVPLPQWLRSRETPVHDRIANRLENLGITSWGMWARGGRDVTDVLAERPDATVVDLGGFATSAEPKTAALAILDYLWEHRSERVGRLIVIDEAHNLCSPNPASAVDQLLTEKIVQIAAEGRKYGLWLLLSTQRPSKVHHDALSQCDNLGLMRMSSPRDLAELGLAFGYAPEALLNRATDFAQGQALFAGGFTAAPQLVQMGTRLTYEGGIDVPIRMR